MIKKYPFAILLMLPLLFFGKNTGSPDDDSKPEPSTVGESMANAAYFAVELPDELNCQANDTFSWENNVSITNTGAVDADLRFIDSVTDLSFVIPGPYPTEFNSPVVININEAISWDGYAGRTNTQEQLFERWKVVFLKNGVIQFNSDYTGDLQDGVESAQWKGALNQNIRLPEGVDQILLVHYEDDTYGTANASTANSVVPSSICFSYAPICDIQLSAGDDITECTDENIALTATYSSSDVCLTGCAYPVLDAQKCSGTSEEVYLFTTNGNASERKFQATSQNFETFSDGTARYTATATNGIDVVEVNMLYSGRTSNAPANNPKEHDCGGSQDTAGFEYYPTLNGRIVSQNHGTFYASTMGASFQIGEGGDVQRTGFGASGWFTLTGGDGYYYRGDVNIALGSCVVQSANEASFLWSTTDGTIVGNANQETIEVSASGTYTVTVTNCNGCEATDDVHVTIVEKLTIGDFVFEDNDRDGLRGLNEVGVDGLSVSLFTADGSVAGDTTTANGGEYTFEVCPGEYYVVFGNVPEGYEFTSADAGDDTLDSDANANGRTPNFVIGDMNNYTIDAGLVKICTIDPTVNGEHQICAGEVSTLEATGGDTYLWSTGETSASIEVTPEVTTTYTVTVSDSTIADCSAEASFTVTVSSVNINADPDVSIAFGDSTTLTVEGADASDTIIWSTGETTSSISVVPEVSTTYSVTVVNTLGCMDEDSVTVNVIDECGINPAFKILPRDKPGTYAPGYETAACIGDDLYLWMYTDLDNLNYALNEDYTDWSFTYEFPNGTIIVQSDRPNYPGNHRLANLDLAEDDFGEYKISWVSPTGCTGTTIFTLNFPDDGCGDNGTRTSDFYMVEAVYPIPAAAGSALTLEVSTQSESLTTLASKNARNTSGKTPELVSRKETVRVSVYNFHGRQVGNTQTFDVEQGKVKVYYQLGNLATGNYIIQVEGDSWRDSKQIMIE